MERSLDRGRAVQLLFCMREVMARNRNYLIDLDSAVGDGDLGLTMSDGFAAAHEAVKGLPEPDLGKLFYAAGRSMAGAVPSTMGTLMASGWMRAGKALRGREAIDADGLAELFDAYAQGVADRGGASPGEKTFLDGLLPAVESLRQSAAQRRSLLEAAQLAHNAAQKGFQSTVGMLARHGRAAGRGEQSRSLPDPGAAVAVLMMEALLDFAKDESETAN